MNHTEVSPDPPPPANLTIPFDVESILPGRFLSVAELLRFRFPTPFYAPHNGAGVPVWSGSPPHEIRAAILLGCVVPFRGTVKQLLSDLRKLSSIPQSFNRITVSSCEVLPNRLPIWVLSFWDRLSEAYEARLSWRKCLDWTNAPFMRPGNQQYAGDLDSLTHQVCWCGYLEGNRGDRHVNDIFDLLSNNELNSGQINDLLELLERRLADSSDSRFLIAPTELSNLILHSHRNHTRPTYQKQHAQRSTEEGLVQRRWSAVASVAWISVGDCGHWISYIIDPINSTIFHGDSLGLRMPTDLCEALQWWLCDLQRKMGEPITPPCFKSIAATVQKDGFSCGILSTNSLFHHLLPCKFSLLPSDAVSIRTYRIKRTVEILKLCPVLVRFSLGHCACFRPEILSPLPLLLDSRRHRCNPRRHYGHPHRHYSHPHHYYGHPHRHCHRHHPHHYLCTWHFPHLLNSGPCGARGQGRKAIF